MLNINILLTCVNNMHMLIKKKKCNVWSLGTIVSGESEDSWSDSLCTNSIHY